MIGNCVVDQIWRLTDYPEEDSEQRAPARVTRVGGNAGNSALILAALGQQVVLLNQFARDADGEWLRQRLDQAGIDTHLCSAVEGATPTSCIWLNQGSGSRTIVHHRDLPELSAETLNQLDYAGYDWIHLEGRNIMVLQQALPHIRRSSTATLSLEIEKPREGIEALLQWVDSVVVSRDYLQARGIDAETAINEFGAINPQLQIACTEGGGGVTWSESAGLSHIDAEEVTEIVDTTGAGDCFIAGMIDARLRGRDFAGALEFAKQLAASKIRHYGMNFDRSLING